MSVFLGCYQLNKTLECLRVLLTEWQCSKPSDTQTIKLNDSLAPSQCSELRHICRTSMLWRFSIYSFLSTHYLSILIFYWGFLCPRQKTRECCIQINPEIRHSQSYLDSQNYCEGDSWLFPSHIFSERWNFICCASSPSLPQHWIDRYICRGGASQAWRRKAVVAKPLERCKLNLIWRYFCA